VSKVSDNSINILLTTFRGAPDPELCYPAGSGSEPDPSHLDPGRIRIRIQPDPDTLDPAGSGPGSDPFPPNSPDIRSDPDLDPVHRSGAPLTTFQGLSLKQIL